jgi:ABC-2 type transport system ATP-binding protein
VSEGNNYAIDVQNLVKTYDNRKRAVDGLSFHVEKGEIYGLLGKNGAGKSTTIKMLTTLIPPTSGKAEISGIDIVKKPNLIRKIVGVVQQEEAFDFTTVENNFKIYGMLWEVPKEKVRERMESLLELFNLSDMRKKRVFELSGGQKKRLQVAREFIHDMDVLFLDEPTVGMDPIMRRSVLDFISEKAKSGLTILFTTQILEEADYICRRVGIIDKGKLVAEGSSEELKNRYGTAKKLLLKLAENMDEKTKVDMEQFFSSMKGIDDFEISQNRIWVMGREMNRAMNEIMKKLSSLTVEVDQISLDTPSLDDVFLDVVKR